MPLARHAVGYPLHAGTRRRGASSRALASADVRPWIWRRNASRSSRVWPAGPSPTERPATLVADLRAQPRS